MHLLSTVCKSLTMLKASNGYIHLPQFLFPDFWKFSLLYLRGKWLVKSFKSFKSFAFTLNVRKIRKPYSPSLISPDHSDTDLDPAYQNDADLDLQLWFQLVTGTVQTHRFSISSKFVQISVADPGCLSRIRLFSIPDPGSELSPSRILIKEFKYFIPKKSKKNGFQALKNMIRVVHPGSRIRMLTFSQLGFRIQGSKRHPIPDPGSGSTTLVQTHILLCCETSTIIVFGFSTVFVTRI